MTSAAGARPRLGFNEALDGDGCLRPAYARIARTLGHDPLAPPARVAQRLAARPLGDDTRIVPVPFALDDTEYLRVIRPGVAQRARTLQRFFGDVVLSDVRGPSQKAGLTASMLDEILASEGTSLEQLRRLWRGQTTDAIRFVYGADLVRDPHGRWLVLEDNVGCVGGAADSFCVADAFWAANGIRMERDHESDLLAALRRWLSLLRLRPGDDGVMALVEDEEAALRSREDARRAVVARALGVEVATGAYLQFPRRLRAVFNLGAHGAGTRALLAERFRETRVPLLNAPGTGVLGNKALLPFVDELIRWYCGEDPLLVSASTVAVRPGAVLENPADWVVKPATGCGGSGVVFLGALAGAELEPTMAALGSAWPAHAAVVQRYVEPSRLPLFGSREYSAELRAYAYALSDRQLVVGEHLSARVVPVDETPRPHNLSRGAAYAPVIRVAIKGPTPRRAA